MGGYVYLGLIGRVPDSSYNIEVTLNELSASDPTELFYCPGLATNVGTTSACDTVLSSVAIPSFYKLYIGTKDVDYKIAGFAWFQGWSDASRKPDWVEDECN